MPTGSQMSDTLHRSISRCWNECAIGERALINDMEKWYTDNVARAERYPDIYISKSFYNLQHALRRRLDTQNTPTNKFITVNGVELYLKGSNGNTDWLIQAGEKIRKCDYWELA